MISIIGITKRTSNLTSACGGGAEAGLRGRAFFGAIEGLKQKAMSHVDSGKAYHDKWCHQDKGYTYFNMTNEGEGMRLFRPVWENRVIPTKR
jgi:hypothetical protein